MTNLAIGMCWMTLPKAGFVDLVELSARFGFPTLSVGPKLVLDRIEAGETPAALRRRLKDAGVRVAYVDAIVTGLPGLPAPTPPSDAESCFAAAEILEAPMVNVAHYRGKPVGFAALADGVGELCRQADARGLNVGLEPIAGTAFHNLAGTQQIIEACGAANCGLLFDPTHWSRAGDTVADIAALKPGSITGFQLCDRTFADTRAAQSGIMSRDLPGEGELPLWDVTAAVLANNPALTVELEVISPVLDDMALEAAAQRCRTATDAWLAARPE